MARRRTGRKGPRPPARQHAGAPGGTSIATLAGAGKQAARPTSAEAVEPEALVATWCFDSGEAGEPYTATVRFIGRRIGVHGNPKPSDTFVKEETIEEVVPGTGPVSITTFVYGLRPGDWNVNAELVGGSRNAGTPADRAKHIGGRPVRRAMWSWRRWALTARDDAPVKTRWALLAPLAGQPAVLPGSYTALAILGFVVALALQAAILARANVDVGQSLIASGIAIAAGLLAAKAWYTVLHPDESFIRGGWAVDGFLVVVPLVAAGLLYAFDLPIGRVLDAAAPGIFFAVAIGRIGCFLTGCCAGRCTASRWGIWSSDRRVGARRFPAQLIESAAGLLLGVATLMVVLADALPVHGLVFVSAFAVYSVVRQVLLRARAERRRSYRTLPLTAAAAAVTTVAVTFLALLQET